MDSSRYLGSDLYRPPAPSVRPDYRLFFPSKMFRWKWLWFTEWVLPIQRNLKWIETHRRTKREKKSGWLSRFKWNRTDGSSATQPPLRTTPHPVHGTNSEFQPKYFANMFICIWSNWKWIQLFFSVIKFKNYHFDYAILFQLKWFTER